MFCPIWGIYCVTSSLEHADRLSIYTTLLDVFTWIDFLFTETTMPDPDSNWVVDRQLKSSLKIKVVLFAASFWGTESAIKGAPKAFFHAWSKIDEHMKEVRSILVFAGDWEIL